VSELTVQTASDVRKASSVLMIFQLYRARGGQFNWWRKPEYLEKTTDLPKWGVSRYDYVVV
jgi:predicted metal-binding protein